MAQPPLSHHLKVLEEELGVTLFERTKPDLELTPAGKILLEKVESLFHHMEETYAEVKEAAEGIRGELSIGFMRSCFSYIPSRIRYFQLNYPLVKFKLREGDPYQIGEMLRKREIDIGITRLPLDLNDFSTLSLPKEKFVAVLPKQWAIGKTHLSVKDMEHLPLLLLHRVKGVGVYDLIIQECNRNGFQPKIVCECPDSYALLQLVENEVGATIIPESTLISSTKGIRVIELMDFEQYSESAVVWLKERNVTKMMKHFLDTFEVLKEET